MLLSFGTALLAFVFASDLATNDIKTAVQLNRFDIGVESGALIGPGAEKLRAAEAQSCYVFLGEDHGIAEVARFADGLTRELQPLGYNTFALEVSPTIAKELAIELASSEPERAHSLFIRQHPLTVPFYNTEEEFAFLQHAQRRSGNLFSIIGFDQEFIGSGRFLLEQVAKQDLTPELRNRLERFSRAEERAWARAEQSGKVEDLFLLSADVEELEDFAVELRRGGFDSKPIDGLLQSHRIYDLFYKNAYKSNEERDRAMKHALVAARGNSPPCKVFFKGGGNHGFRGLGPLRTRELGNFLSEMADVSASGSGLHILLINGGKGQQLMFDAVGKPLKAVPVDATSSSFALHAFAPFIELASQHQAWSLFDLRPLRSLPDVKFVDTELQRIVYAYDTPLAARPPASLQSPFTDLPHARSPQHAVRPLCAHVY